MTKFLAFTKGMTAAELCILLQCAKGNPGVFFYHPEQLLATQLLPHQVPWPVEFVLRFHPKHIWVGKRLPPLQELSKSISQWEHKMRWRLFHSQADTNDEQNSSRQNRWSKIRERFATPLCPHRFGDDWENFFYEFKQSVFQQAFAMRRKSKTPGHNYSNFNSVAKWGLQLLREGPVGAVRTDKDGGYALVWKQSLTKAICKYLCLPKYEERLVHEYTFHDLVDEYCGLVKYIGEETEDEDLANSMLSSLRRGCKSFVTKILTTVKTHKPEGQQSMRIVHAAPRHFAKPAMRWISATIQHHLKQFNHILKDTDHLLQLLRNIQVPDNALLVRFDIKEFFMSGTHKAICEAAQHVFPPSCRKSALLMVEHILKSQIVTDEWSKKYFRVKIGSGMGLVCSGELSDSAFCHLAEQDFVATPSIQQKYGIVFYGRFKDDGLIILTAPRELRNEFAALFKAKAQPFTIQFEQTSWESVTMMDVTLEKGKGWKKTGILDYTIFKKPSNQWQPLLCSSFHHPGVHVAWPYGQLHRITRRCSDPSIAKSEIRHFCEQYLRHTGRKIDWNGAATRPRQRDESTQLPRLIVPYRTAWFKTRISHICKRIWQRCKMDKLTGHNGSLQVSWSLPNRHLVQQIRESNSENVHGGDRGWLVGKYVYFYGREVPEQDS